MYNPMLVVEVDGSRRLDRKADPWPGDQNAPKQRQVSLVNPGQVTPVRPRRRFSGAATAVDAAIATSKTQRPRASRPGSAQRAIFDDPGDDQTGRKPPNTWSMKDTMV